MLHITNGDAAVAALTRAGIAAADALPWRDVLHEGPVPAGLTLDELSVVRADFIAACGWGERDVLQEHFRQRDVRLAGAQAEDEAVLWFESDLYDQLQLLQLIDWFVDPAHRPARLSLVCVDRNPETGRFQGLGQIEAQRLQLLLAQREPVNREQLAIGARGWAAFRHSDPCLLDALRGEDTTALPYLRDALTRLLQELPAAGDGLTRVERTVLEILSHQDCGWRELFVRVNAREARPFLGDTVFERILARLTDAAVPLATGVEPSACKRVLTLTPAGMDALEGRLDAVQVNGIDRWLGGTRLWRGEKVWRWSGAAGSVIRDQ